jgi:DNA adenine methylase
MFFAKEPAEVEAINDIDGKLIEFYRGFDCPDVHRCTANYERLQGQDRIQRWRDAVRRVHGGPATSCDYFVARRDGMFGTLPQNPSRTNIVASLSHKGKVARVAKGVNDRCHEYAARLEHADIRNEDWRATMRRYQGPDVVAYLDPPYPTTTVSRFYNSPGVSPEDVCGFLRGWKGKFILSFPDTPQVRQACSGFRMTPVDIKYNGLGRSLTNGKLNPKRGRELLISNFDLTGYLT